MEGGRPYYFTNIWLLHSYASTNWDIHSCSCSDSKYTLSATKYLRVYNSFQKNRGFFKNQPGDLFGFYWDLGFIVFFTDFFYFNVQC